MYLSVLVVQFQNGHKCFLRNLYVSNLTHTFFTFFLFLEKFTLTGNISTITFGSYVFSQGFDGFTSDDFSTNRSLNRNVELLSWNWFTQFLGNFLSELI